MIKIDKTYPERECNCCLRRNKVMEIFFRSDMNRQGIAVALCEDCRKKLRRVIYEEDGDQDE